MELLDADSNAVSTIAKTGVFLFMLFYIRDGVDPLAVCSGFLSDFC